MALVLGVKPFIAANALGIPSDKADQMDATLVVGRPAFSTAGTTAAGTVFILRLAITAL